MQNSTTFRNFFNRNGYLLVLAAWLITISFVVDNYWSANASISKVAKEISGNIHRHEQDFKKLVSDTAAIRKISRSNFSESFLGELVAKKYFTFFYINDNTSHESLVCWNTQQVLPYPSLLYERRNKGFVKLQNGFYVWNRYNLGTLKALALIPVKWDYIVENDYLENRFIVDKSFTPNYNISSVPGKGVAINSIDGKVLFYVQQTASGAVSRNNPLAAMLQIAAALLVLFFIHLYASFLVSTKSLRIGISFLFLAILILRVAGYYFNFPMNFRQFELFDPSIYRAGPVLRSLGDLFINSILFAWIILFIRQRIAEREVQSDFQLRFSKWLLLAGGTVIIIAASFTGSYIIRSLVASSSISFDVINFFTLNIYSVIGFVVLCCISIAYYFLCQVIIYFIRPFFPNGFLSLYLFVAVAGLIMLSFKIGDIPGGFEIYVLLWLELFLLLLNSRVLNMLASKIISSRLVFWLVFFSMSVTTVIVLENNAKELRVRMQSAEKLARTSDPTSEVLLNSMLTVFRDDFLADNFSRFETQEENLLLKDSLMAENTTSYTSNYDTKVFTYNADEKPLFNTGDAVSYNEINTIVNTQAKPTSVPGLFYYDKSFDIFSYISKKTITGRSGNLLGYVFIQASPKKQKAEALSATIFSGGEDNSIENSSLYAYAIYKNRKLVTMHNDYPFPSVISKADFPVAQTKFVTGKKHTELWYYAGADKMIVIAKENSLIIESITLFSYLFCSFLIVTAFFWIINIFIRSRFRLSNVRTYGQLSIRNQIHGTIIFISAVSFFVIGFATILFFISRYENNNREKLSRTIQIMEKEVLSSISNGWKAADTLHMNDKKYEQRFGDLINKISGIHGVDVNMYDLQGNLRVSSLPLPYIKGILSTKMHPLAFYHLSNKSEVQYFQKENMGKLKFISNYVPVKDAAGNDYAYLNIPYFASQTNLKQEISNFLVTIINLNAFIFLIAGIVALFITNRITNSFSVISDKMKRINLGARNEAIDWKRNDELGELVNEYNKMVSKLEESARILARTEREGAWREMARQVAHEIKNPLTPMKLSMQFLQKSIENNAPNVKELTATVAKTLVEQIDHLSHIAGEFSQFANIGDSKKEVFDMNSILKNVLLLYAVSDKLEIIQDLLPGTVMINADKTHINRLFTNLVLNAIQAVPESKSPRIVITESILDHHVLIQIKDNGQGIDEEIRSRIFTPNFTTKTSGTGLGLAMCKRIIEQAEGKIWFETAIQEGTSFFIKIPLADYSHN